MPIVKKPSPMPSAIDYVPPDSAPYHVQRGDSWWSLVDLPGPRSQNMSASDLCQFNFRTRKGAEINWYLQNKVGCRNTTKSGDNYVFNGADMPGIVYLPKVGAPPPANEVDPHADYTQIWVGPAVKAGTTVVIAGTETATGLAVSVDNPRRWMSVTASTSRLGPGFGATGGVSIMIIGGVKRAADLNGHIQGGIDFNFAIGVKIGAAAKATKNASKYRGLLGFFKKIGFSKAGFKAAMKDPDKIADLTKLVKTNYEAWGFKKNQPSVTFIDIPPAGGGAEVSIYHAVSEFVAIPVGAD